MAGETGWRPEYPEQTREPSWIWWERGEYEGDLLGFHTKQDRDRYSRGGSGPFRRRLCARGQDPIPQSRSVAP